ncbi:MAG: peptide ABC transporter permease [Sulfuricurvum sp. GWF2_44_89]|nr:MULTISPECIES: ABC transporter permease [unclassified Sulfuricurvum]OHD78218.1 MAG: peptide ABC transporter permease [Sulfuricurvum sp. GWF2_44_89]OHD94115.1 MAG: peptide ABC transporter permease [Sulfuricurvum sp. RIFOXYD2_FULL_44_160]OHD96005.1 MAG: peptide ABC transporter permease [Sulfuricurvum sp. RIFOXYD12_FULL_44_77]
MKYFLKSVLYTFLMLFLISLLSFGAIHMAPNSFMGGELNPNMTPEAIAQLRAIYGLDKPLLLQYMDWVGNLLTLNFGLSFVSGAQVSEVVSDRLPVTLWMNIVAMAITFAVSLWMGIKAALSHGKKADTFLSQLALFSFAMPSYYLALVAMMILSVMLGWFPIAGMHSLEPPEGIGYYLDMAWHLTLPIAVMVFVGIGSLVLYVRSLTLEILKSDYIYFARSRGIEESKIIRRYILPNLLPPIVTMLGLSLPGLIGGSVILESIFGIEGMGQLFYLSAMSRDYPVIMGILMMSAFLTLIGNQVADAVLLKLNPFVKR